jgi:hypothetical protein
VDAVPSADGAALPAGDGVRDLLAVAARERGAGIERVVARDRLVAVEEAAGVVERRVRDRWWADPVEGRGLGRP